MSLPHSVSWDNTLDMMIRHFVISPPLVSSHHFQACTSSLNVNTSLGLIPMKYGGDSLTEVNSPPSLEHLVAGRHCKHLVAVQAVSWEPFRQHPPLLPLSLSISSSISCHLFFCISCVSCMSCFNLNWFCRVTLVVLCWVKNLNAGLSGKWKSWQRDQSEMRCIIVHRVLVLGLKISKHVFCAMLWRLTLRGIRPRCQKMHLPMMKIHKTAKKAPAGDINQ